MKRFHVHISVTDLEQSIGFYSSLFGTSPTVEKSDYAKWMLDDPRINFAISKHAKNAGVNHLGLQVDSDGELRDMEQRLRHADASLVEEIGANCCYARSDKYWVTDPQGVAWETFHSLGTIPVYGNDVAGVDAKTACCVPAIETKERAPKAGCCGA